MPGRKGNTNALKHGLYARNFTDADRTDLRKMPFDDLRAEIAALRVIGEKILALLKDNKESDTIAKLANSFSLTVAQINTSMRTQALLQGTYNPLDDAINEVFKNFEPYETTDELSGETDPGAL